MQATTKAQHTVAVARWYGTAKFFPRGSYTVMARPRMGRIPRRGCTSRNPEDLTPWNWQPPLTVPLGWFYDPRTGGIYPRGVQPPNDLDPTSPTFVEPPELA